MNNIDRTWKQIIIPKLHESNMLEFKDKILNESLYYPKKKIFLKFFKCL